LEKKKKEDFYKLLADTEEQDKINCVFDEYEHQNVKKIVYKALEHPESIVGRKFWRLMIL
jgi:hypothetical protein